jgi:hypothetical protein
LRYKCALRLNLCIRLELLLQSAYFSEHLDSKIDFAKNYYKNSSNTTLSRKVFQSSQLLVLFSLPMHWFFSRMVTIFHSLEPKNRNFGENPARSLQQDLRLEIAKLSLTTCRKKNGVLEEDFSLMETRWR